MIKKGNTDIGAVYLGSTAISAIYKGATEIWSAGISYLGKFFTRSTAGGTSIGNGTAKIKSLRGNSTVQSGRLLDFVSTPNALFNQLIQNGDVEKTYSGAVPWGGITYSTSGIPESANNHKYYCSLLAKGKPGTAFVLGLSSGTISQTTSLNQSTFTRLNGIVTKNFTGTQLALYDSGSGEQSTAKNAMCIDLTAIFGAGNEPSSVAEFEQWMRMYGMNPDDFQEYNAGGTLNGSRIESRNSNDAVISSVKLPTPSTGNLILRSAGNVYDEVIGTKVIRRVGVRAYQSGDENNPALLTDMTNTNYPLATSTEETIPAWSNTYQAENGGTETLLPANTSEPYTSEVWADILYKKQ